MTNYEAIRGMTPAQMDLFLVHVYLTGVNDGIFAATVDDDDYAGFLGDSYRLDWLMDSAEQATALVQDENGELYLPAALVRAMMRNAIGSDGAACANETAVLE